MPQVNTDGGHDSLKREYDLQGERRAVAAATGRWLESVLPLQRFDGSDQDGGFDEGSLGWCDGRQAAYNLARLAGALQWVFSGDVDFEPEPIRHAIRRAAAFIVRRQRDDGWLDLSGNYSPNEAGFPIPGIARAYRSIEKLDPALFEQTKPELDRFILRAADAVLHGEAYTANHRWTAAAAPLAAAHSLFPDERYLKKIESYLADGIDCDDAGMWYEERSPNYNIVANAGMMALADFLNRPELLDPVVRNLGFTLFTMQPNGEADSSFSHRQDRAAPNRPAASLSQARRVAQITGDGRFSSLAHMLVHGKAFDPINELVPIHFEIDSHPEPLPPLAPMPDDYEWVDPRGPLARLRRGRTALSLHADHGGHYFSDVRDRWGGVRLSDDWFHLHHGDAVIQSIHLAPAGMYAIQPTSLEQLAPANYRLRGGVESWTHTLHFRPGSPTMQMPWKIQFEIDVDWSVPDAIRLRIAANTPQALVANLTFWIRRGAEFEEAETAAKNVQPGQRTMINGGGALRLKSADSVIEIDSLPRAAHRWPISLSQPIPSVMSEHCGALSLGLRFPVHLELTLKLK